MKAIIEHMFRVQKLLRPGNAPIKEQQAVLRELRDEVPAPVLAHYLRLVGIGQNGVALVRHGVCGECHISVPSGTLAALYHPTDVHLCECCGCYLILPAEEVPHRTSPRPLPVARRVADKCAVA